MNRRRKVYTGGFKGTSYQLTYDKVGNQQACDERFFNEWRWFLIIGEKSDQEYIGDFDSKDAAMAMLDLIV